MSSSDRSPSTEQTPSSRKPRASTETTERPTSRTALRDLERQQFAALEAAQLRDLGDLDR
jgi:hypothetical protein